MSDEMKKIKELEEDLQDLQNERKVLDKKVENIELERKVLINKEQEIREEINEIKNNGVNHFLGQYAMVHPRWGNSDFYIFITSIATEYNGCLAAFSGPYFRISEDYDGSRDINISCNHSSAHDMGTHISIDRPEDVTIITKEEYLAAFDKFQEQTKQLIIASINARPRKKTKTEWKYEDDKYEIKD